jgi:predicted porin
MKKSLLALAALTAFAGVASAQSSVTVAGVVDMAARNVKNGPAGSLKTLSTDGLSSSNLTFRGVEDLGGGLRAAFHLESGIGPDTGGAGASGGAFWNRRSTASLLGGFGELRLGRDYVPTFWNHSQFAPFGTNGVASSTNLINPGTAGASGSNTTKILGVPSSASGDARNGTAVRADNSIQYFLPAMGGLYGNVMVAAGEGAIGNKYTGMRLGYAAGPLNFAVGYGQTDLVQAKLKAFNIGGTFNAGFATFYALYNDYKVGSGEPANNGLTNGASTSAGNPSDRNLKNYLLGVGVPLGGGTFKASFAKTKGDLNSTTAAGVPSATNRTVLDASATNIAVGYVYDLSKRTALYTHFSSIKNKKGARFYASGSGPSYTTSPAADFTSNGYEFGLRHSF